MTKLVWKNGRDLHTSHFYVAYFLATFEIVHHFILELKYWLFLTLFGYFKRNLIFVSKKVNKRRNVWLLQPRQVVDKNFIWIWHYRPLTCSFGNGNWNLQSIQKNVVNLCHISDITRFGYNELWHFSSMVWTSLFVPRRLL